jgi:hypothetical protein
MGNPRSDGLANVSTAEHKQTALRLHATATQGDERLKGGWLLVPLYLDTGVRRHTGMCQPYS